MLASRDKQLQQSFATVRTALIWASPIDAARLPGTPELDAIDAVSVASATGAAISQERARRAAGRLGQQRAAAYEGFTFALRQYIKRATEDGDEGLTRWLAGLADKAYGVLGMGLKPKEIARLSPRVTTDQLLHPQWPMP